MKKLRRGFTLVELVVVVLILGILAAVAAPKFGSQTKQAAESGLKQSLAIVRDAVSTYAVGNNSELPLQTATTKDQPQFLAEIQPMLRSGKFPRSPVATNGSLTITIKETGTFVPSDITNLSDWIYYVADGRFVVDSDTADENGIKYHDF